MGRRPRGCSERVERMASAWSVAGSMGVGGWKVAYMWKWSEEGCGGSRRGVDARKRWEISEWVDVENE